MATIDPKRRMVSFRLSAAEYAQAESVSRSREFRSLSLFARASLLEAISTHNGTGGLDPASKEDLRQRVDFLAAELRRVSEYVRLAVRFAAPPDERSSEQRAAGGS